MGQAISCVGTNTLVSEPQPKNVKSNLKSKVVPQTCQTQEIVCLAQGAFGCIIDLQFFIDFLERNKDNIGNVTINKEKRTLMLKDELINELKLLATKNTYVIKLFYSEQDMFDYEVRNIHNVLEILGDHEHNIGIFKYNNNNVFSFTIDFSNKVMIKYTNNEQLKRIQNIHCILLKHCSDDMSKKPLRSIVDHKDNIINVLQKLHKHGIVHKDIKPENIMVCGDSIQIIDYGNASLRNDHDVFFSPASTHLYAYPPYFLACYLSTTKNKDENLSYKNVYEYLTLSPENIENKLNEDKTKDFFSLSLVPKHQRRPNQKRKLLPPPKPHPSHNLPIRNAKHPNQNQTSNHHTLLYTQILFDIPNTSTNCIRIPKRKLTRTCQQVLHCITYMPKFIPHICKCIAHVILLFFTIIHHTIDSQLPPVFVVQIKKQRAHSPCVIINRMQFSDIQCNSIVPCILLVLSLHVFP